MKKLLTLLLQLCVCVTINVGKVKAESFENTEITKYSMSDDEYPKT